MIGSRVTDAVEFFRQREEYRHALRLVRERSPDARRWRSAMGRMSFAAASLRGRDRMRVEEPLREVVVDVADRGLRTELVLDARRMKLDLDRGELLAPKTFGDLRRAAFLTSVDLDIVRGHLALPDDFFAPVDVAGVVVVSRCMSEAYERRAERLSLDLPGDEDSVLSARQLGLRSQVERDRGEQRRWSALARVLLDSSGA